MPRRQPRPLTRLITGHAIVLYFPNGNDSVSEDGISLDSISIEGKVNGNIVIAGSPNSFIHTKPGSVVNGEIIYLPTTLGLPPPHNS